MRRRILNSILTLAALTVGADSLVAAPFDAETYRHIDEIVYSINGEARQLHWDVRSHIAGTPDHARLCREALDVIGSVRDLEDALLRGHGPQATCGEIDDVKEDLCDLRDRLKRCDLGAIHRHCVAHRRSRQHVAIGQQNLGAYYVRNIEARIVRMTQALDTLHDELTIHSGGVAPAVVPQQRYEVQPRPTYGVPTTPQAPYYNQPPQTRPSVPSPGVPYNVQPSPLYVPSASNRSTRRPRSRDVGEEIGRLVLQKLFD